MTNRRSSVSLVRKQRKWFVTRLFNCLPSTVKFLFLAILNSTVKETAERLHLSVAAVKSRLLRARVMLSHILRPFEPKTRQRRAEVPSIAITSAETVLDKITKARGHKDAHRHNSGCGAAIGG